MSGSSSSRACGATSPETIAELLARLPTKQGRRELEDYRIDWERTHGPVDLTRSYTSMLPAPAQEFLYKHHPKRYFDGLPPFFQSYLRSHMERAAAQGRLDDISDTYLKLFLTGQMGFRDDSKER